MSIICRFLSLRAINWRFWIIRLMNKHRAPSNTQADLISRATQYLPQNDGIDWYPICIDAITHIAETLARNRTDWPAAVPLLEWRLSNPVSIASCAFNTMPVEYKFGPREKWMRRLDQVYFEELARFRESESVRLSGSIDGTR